MISHVSCLLFLPVINTKEEKNNGTSHPLKFSTICSHLLVAKLSFVKKLFFFFLAELSFLNLSVGDYYSIRLAPQHASSVKVVFAIKYSYIN